MEAGPKYVCRMADSLSGQAVWAEIAFRSGRSNKIIPCKNKLLGLSPTQEPSSRSTYALPSCSFRLPYFEYAFDATQPHRLTNQGSRSTFEVPEGKRIGIAKLERPGGDTEVEGPINTA